MGPLCGLGLGLSLGLGRGLGPEEPETIGDAGTSTFPILGVSRVGKLPQLVAATLWRVGLDCSNLLIRTPRATGCVLMAMTLALLSCFLVRPVLLG